MPFLTSRKLRNQNKLENTGAGWLERTINKLEKNNFNNILAVKISVVFKVNSTNSYSADTSLDTFSFRFYQKNFN